MNKKLTLIWFFELALAVLCIVSCSANSYTTYHVKVSIEEFEVKPSTKNYEEYPKLIRVSTGSGRDESAKYNTNKLNFMSENGAALVLGKDGDAKKKINFTVALYYYAYDGIADFLFDDEDSYYHYIDGANISIDIPIDSFNDTVVVDNEKIYLRFTYSISDIKRH